MHFLKFLLPLLLGLIGSSAVYAGVTKVQIGKGVFDITPWKAQGENEQGSRTWTSTLGHRGGDATATLRLSLEKGGVQVQAFGSCQASETRTLLIWTWGGNTSTFRDCGGKSSLSSLHKHLEVGLGKTLPQEVTTRINQENGWEQDVLGAWYKYIGRPTNWEPEAQVSVFRTKQGETQYMVLLTCVPDGEKMKLIWTGLKEKRVLDRVDCPGDEARRGITPETMWPHFGQLPLGF